MYKTLGNFIMHTLVLKATTKEDREEQCKEWHTISINAFIWNLRFPSCFKLTAFTPLKFFSFMNQNISFKYVTWVKVLSSVTVIVPTDSHFKICIPFYSACLSYCSIYWHTKEMWYYEPVHHSLKQTLWG